MTVKQLRKQLARLPQTATVHFAYDGQFLGDVNGLFEHNGKVKLISRLSDIQGSLHMEGNRVGVIQASTEPEPAHQPNPKP